MDKNNTIETIKMLDEENLDIRTLTMGISLFDCIDKDYKKVVSTLKNLTIELDDIFNKRKGVNEDG